MFVYGTLDMAGFEIISGPTLPSDNLWEGRVVWWNGQVYYVKAGAWEAIAVTSAGVLPPQLGEQNKLLTTDGLNTFWTADPAGHDGEYLKWDGVSHGWDHPLPIQSGNANRILSTDGVAPFWTADPSSAVPGQFLQWDGSAHVWADTPLEIPSPVGETNKILISDGLVAFWGADPALATMGQFLQWDGLGHVWADPPTGIPLQTGNANQLLATDGTDPFWTADPSGATPGQFLQWDGTLHVWADAPTGMPPMAGKTDWLLTNNGLGPVWTADPSGATPGQFLQWDGALHVWADPPGSIPAMAGHDGEWLRTDGLISFWEAIERVDLVPIPGEPNYVLINDALGAMSAEVWLNQTRGGFGQDVSGFSGFVQAGPAGQFFAQPLQPGDMPSGIDASDISSGIVNNAMFDRVAGLGRFEASSIISGGVLSVNANPARFDMTAGDGLIIDYVTNPATPIITPVTWTAQTAVVITGLAVNDLTYLIMNAAGALIQQSTFPTPVQLRDNIYIGLIVHSNHSSITYINSVGNHNESLGNQFFDFMNAVGPFNVVGNTITPNGANLTFQKAAGLMFSAYYNQATTPKNPHIVQNFQAIPASFAYRTQLGGSTGNVTNIDPTTWDNGGTLQAVGGTANATVQRVYLFPNNLIRVQYGQKVYPNLANALNEMGYEAFVTAPSVRGLGILIGYIVAQNNATDLSNTTKARIINAARFDVGPAAGSLATTDIQIAYENSGFPVLVLNSGIGTFNIRDAATPIIPDLFSVASNDGVTKYLEVDNQGLKTSNVLPGLALVSNANGAIASLPGVSAAEVGFLDGVTGPIQPALDAKAVIGGSLAQFGPTTSAELLALITDETGTGLAVFNNSPLLLAPRIDNGAAFVQETTATAVTPALGSTSIYPKADNKWYSKDSGGAELPVGGGLLPLAISAGPVTAAPGTHYLTDTTAAGFTINLPAGSTGASLKFTDAAETWGTNNLTIAPATGQKIDMLAINETLVCDVVRGWVDLNWNGSYWVFGSLASTQVGVASATTAGILTTGTQSIAGAKTFLQAATFSSGIAGPTTFSGALTPSGGIVGKTDGVPYTSTFIGYILSATQAGFFSTTTTGSFVDAPDLQLTVPPGVWLLTSCGSGTQSSTTNTGTNGVSIDMRMLNGAIEVASNYTLSSFLIGGILGVPRDIRMQDGAFAMTAVVNNAGPGTTLVKIQLQLNVFNFPASPTGGIRAGAKIYAVRIA